MKATGLWVVLALTVFAYGVTFQNIGPGGGGTLGCLAFEPGNPEVAYAGLDCGGMHATRDGGKTWRNANSGIVFDGHIEWSNHYGLLALEKGKVFCTSSSGKIYFSDNYGQSWKVVFSLSPQIGIGFITRNPHDPNILYAGSGFGRKFLSGELLTTGGVWNGAIYTSLEGGRAGSWKRLNPDSKHNIPSRAGIISLAIDGKDRNLLYAATDFGVYRSQDGGVSWASVQKTLGKAAVRVVATVPGRAGIVYASVGSYSPAIKAGVYRSTNSGESWELIYDAGQGNFSAISVDPINPNVLYLGSWEWGGGLYRSMDGGKTFKPVLTYSSLREEAKQKSPPDYKRCWNPESIHVSVGSALQVGGGDKDGDGLSDAIWFSGDNQGLIYKSIDGGKNWRQAVTKEVSGGRWQGRGEIDMLCVKKILIEPIDPKIIYFIDCDWGQFQSRDGGKSWALIGGPWYPNELVGGSSDMIFDPDDPKIIYCGTGYGYRGPGGVLRGWVSSEPCFQIVGGREKKLNGLPNAVVNSIAAVRSKTGPDRAKYLYAASSENGVYRTNLIKGDWKWEKVSRGLAQQNCGNLYDLVNVPGTLTLYLSTNDGIYRSDDGKSWRKLTGPGSKFPDLNGVKNLAIDLLTPRRVYACQFTSWHGSPEQGLYATEDGGTTWSRIAQINVPYDVTWVPRTAVPTVLVASQTHGVLKVQFDPKSKTWKTEPYANQSNGLSNTRCWTVTVDPHNSRHYFIGTHGTCIFEGTEK
jgi:photosystem II stability/assembly factor-like uncharacterized protein